MEYYNEDYLMHYGVKGMKWGVHKSREQVQQSVQSKKWSTKNNDDKLLKMTRDEARDKLIDNRSNVTDVSNQLKRDYAALKRSKEGRVKYSNMKDSLRKVYSTFDSKDADNYEKAYKEWYDYTRELGKTYADKLNTARVKALGFEDIEVGKKFLKDNFLDIDDNFDVDSYLDRDKNVAFW